MKPSEIKIYIIGVGLIFFVPLTFVYFLTDNTTFLYMGIVVEVSGLLVGVLSYKPKGRKRRAKAVNSSAQIREIPLLVKILLMVVISTTNEQENIIGDLLEASSQFTSKTKAHLWLYKQALKSLLPLVYKDLKGRLASYFGKRIR